MHRTVSFLVLLTFALGLALPLALAADPGCGDETACASESSPAPDCCADDPFCLCCVHSMTALHEATRTAGVPLDAAPLDGAPGAAPSDATPRDILHVPRPDSSV